MERRLATGAVARKELVAQGMADGLVTDPVSQDVYVRYPYTITQNSDNRTITDSTAGQTTTLFQYKVPEGLELQFIPNYAEHFLDGKLRSASGSANDVDGLELRLECWDALERDYRGIIWSGTTTELNDGDVARQNGHPLSYNGEREIRLGGGDLLQLKVTTPTGGTAIDMTPTGVSTISIKCFVLSKKRQ